MGFKGGTAEVLVMCGGLDSDQVRGTLQAMRDALDDEQCAGTLLEQWWSGIDLQYKIAKGRFVAELIERLKQPRADRPKEGTWKEIRNQGMTQKQIARVVGMCEAALSAAKKGAISDEKLNHLIVLAEILGVPIPPRPDVSSDVCDNVSGMICAMQFLSQCVDEGNQPLDETGYRCLRATLNCQEWQFTECPQRELELASQLLKGAGAGGRDAAWLRTVYRQWLPALVAVLEELDAVLNCEGL